MQHNHFGGGDYSQIQPCGHLRGGATLEEACCMVDLVDAKPCKYINIKADGLKSNINGPSTHPQLSVHFERQQTPQVGN